MSREYTLNGSNKKSPISGGRRAPLKLTYSETHRIGEKSRSFDGVTVVKFGVESKFRGW